MLVSPNAIASSFKQANNCLWASDRNPFPIYIFANRSGVNQHPRSSTNPFDSSFLITSPLGLIFHSAQKRSPGGCSFLSIHTLFSPLKTWRDPGCPGPGINADIETIGGSGVIGVPDIVRIRAGAGCSNRDKGVRIVLFVRLPAY